MWHIQTFEELRSTQTLARERLSDGTAQHGDVIIASHQTDGRGRYKDRIWHDEPGANLLMSIVLIDVPDDLQDVMQFAASVCVKGAISAVFDDHFGYGFNDSRIRMKWPNDILLDGKKIAGIIADAVWSGETFKGVVIGIGINVNQTEFPGELRNTSTSLKNVLGDDIELKFLRLLLFLFIEMILQYSRTALVKILRKDFEWMREIESFSLTEPDGTKAEGLRYEGISDDGALVVVTKDGSKKTYQNASLNLS